MELFDFYKGKRVLVTGDTGFKGSWLVRILHLAGAEVTGYALKAPTEPSMFEILHLGETIHHVDGDVRDFAHLKQVFDETKPEIVPHLAAQPIVRESYRSARMRRMSWVRFMCWNAPDSVNPSALSSM